MEVAFRTASVSDAGKISRVLAGSWRTAYRGMIPQSYLDQLSDDHWTPSYTKWIEEQSLEALLLLVNGELVGSTSYGASREAHWCGWAEIVTVYLLPGYWDMGLGRLMMEETLHRLRMKGYRDAYLWVLRENERAARFYRRMGFARTEDELVCELAGRKLTDYRYTIRLADCAGDEKR